MVYLNPKSNIQIPVGLSRGLKRGLAIVVQYLKMLKQLSMAKRCNDHIHSSVTGFIVVEVNVIVG